jgi:hypothetical protein
MSFLRYALPGAVVVGGLVVMALGGANELEGGAGIVSAGLAIYFINWLFRVGVEGEGERDAEEHARDYFDRHGYWPGEGPAVAERPAAGVEPAATAGVEPAATAAVEPAERPARRLGSAAGRAARAPRRR